VREWATPQTAAPRLRLRETLLPVIAGLGLLLLVLAAGVLVVRLGSPAEFRQPDRLPQSSLAATTPSRPSIVASISGLPQRGAIFACQTRFNGGGAGAVGPWIKPDGTVDFSVKPVVDGAIQWTGHLTISLDSVASARTFFGNGLPSHLTGAFPIAQTDDAYAFDRNPNSIRAAPVSLTAPAVPTLAETAACLPMGPIGVLRTGAVLFNALDAAGRDAVAYEIQDACYGHPGPSGAYHYHSLTPCLADSGLAETSGAHSPLAGYAFDGFGLFGPYGEGGAPLISSDLDECHGHTHAIEWDGLRLTLYHYHATWSYPYTVGCFRGVLGPRG
jgi:hypothetical protein